MRSINSLKIGLFFLILVNGILHFSRLNSPDSIVYDEVHNGKYASAYCCTGANQFDVHPPHAKMLLAGAVKIAGYKGDFPFQLIGDPYGDQVPLVAFRFIPALFGFLLPILFLWFLLLVGIPTPFAFLGAFLISFENGFIVQSRFALMDPILISSILLSICLALEAIKRSASKIYYFILFAAGIVSALATGTKLPGGLSLILICLIVLAHFKSKPKKLLFSLCSVLGAYFLFYFAGWWLHFQLMTEPGPGDYFFTQTGNFFSDLWDLHFKMLEENERLSPHPDSSHWWQWFLMRKAVYYWSSGGSDIFFTGNIFTWIGTNIVVIPSIIYMAVKRKLNNFAWVAPSGFIISMSPFLFFHRPLFLYHYLTSLMFAMICSITALSLWIEAKKSRKKYISRIIIALSCLTLVGFAISMPLTFGSMDQDHLLFKIGNFWH